MFEVVKREYLAWFVVYYWESIYYTTYPAW